MKVNINPEANWQDLAEISYKLRYWSKIWKEHYGAHNRAYVKLWEDKMDEWIIKNVTSFNK